MKIVELTVTCEMCPAQIEGKTDDGYFFYSRIRHSYFYVAVDRQIPYLGEAEFSLGGKLPGRYGTGTVDLLERLTRLYIEMIDHEQ